MSVIQLHPDHPETRPPVSDLDIVIPVYNEDQHLEASVTTLRQYLDSSFPVTTTITIVDNASTDDTWRVAARLAAVGPRVQAIHLDQKGRGRALRTGWTRSTAAVVAYMDVDLATGLDALLPLVAPLLSGHSDVAIGTRLAPGAHVIRSTRREFISRGYNVLLRSALRSTCSDAQCGFKAMRRDVAVEILPMVEDNAWFFDTEVLVTAQRFGLRIHEVPVDWVDDPDSRVDVLRTATKDLQGVVRMLSPAARRRVRPHRVPTTDIDDQGWAHISPPPGRQRATPSRRSLSPRAGHPEDPRPEVFSDELLRYAGIGTVSTVAYVGLFAALQPDLGSYLANGVAIALCSLGNTAAHRGMAGSARHGLDRRHRLLASTALLGVSLAFTSGALAVTRSVGLTSLAPELGAVTAATVAAAVIRFAILRTWVFRPEFGTHLPSQPESTPATDLQNPASEMTRAQR